MIRRPPRSTLFPSPTLFRSCIGYKTPPIEGVAYEHGRGRFANSEGVIGEGLYAVGWARRGPTGTIGTNRPDGFEVAEKIFETLGPGDGGKQGGAGLDRSGRAHV